MILHLFAYGIAKDILGKQQMQIDSIEKSKISDIKVELLRRYPDFKKIENLRFAVNDEYCDDDYELKANDELIIIPPVSGG